MPHFLDHVNARVRAGRAVVFCGDVNTADRAIDIARPGPNSKRSGFLPEERAWLDRWTEEGWIDERGHPVGDRLARCRDRGCPSAPGVRHARRGGRMTDHADRARGVLVGLAVGDALGAPVEFDEPERIAGRREELFPMPGGGPSGWAPGEFIDDTQMTLILAGHLARGALDQDALAREFAAWAVHPNTADVGMQTRTVLRAVARGEDWRAAIARLDPEAAGDGS